MNTLTLFDIPLVYYFIGLSFILPRIPIAGKFFNIINTLIHEFGHAFIALLLEGKVYHISIFGDTSGSTVTQSKNRFGSFLVAVSGYLFASSFAYFGFFLLSIGYYNHFIIGLSTLFVIMLILWIRNGYGLFWVILFSLINLLLIYYENSLYIQIAALFYATTILTESVSSAFILLYLSLCKSKEAGDATNLEKLTHIPAFIWALGFTIYACFIAYRIYIDFFV